MGFGGARPVKSGPLFRQRVPEAALAVQRCAMRSSLMSATFESTRRTMGRRAKRRRHLCGAPRSRQVIGGRSRNDDELDRLAELTGGIADHIAATSNLEQVA
jgi:hypothetical protein